MDRVDMSDPVISLIQQLFPFLTGGMVIVLIMSGILASLHANVKFAMECFLAAGASLFLRPMLERMVFQSSQSQYTSPKSSFDFGINWVLVGETALALVLIVGVILLITTIYRAHGRKRAHRREAVRRHDEESRRTATLRAESNRSNVQGVEYALESGSIGQHHLETLDSSALQELVDASNPASGLIVECLHAIEEYESAGSLTTQDRERLTRLRDRLKSLRETPATIRLKAIASSTDDFLERSGEFIQNLDDLAED